MRDLLHSAAVAMLAVMLALVIALVCFPVFGATYIKSQHWQDTDLFRDYSRISGLTTDFCLTEPSHVQTSGFIGLRHRNLVAGPVGWAVRISYRQAATLEQLGPKPWSASPGGYVGAQWIPGAKSAGNIASIEAHYAEASLASYIMLGPGCYRFEVWANSHSSAAPHTDGLVEVNGYRTATPDTYGYMLTTITPDQ